MLHAVNVGLHNVQPNLRAFMVKGKEGREKGKPPFLIRDARHYPYLFPLIPSLFNRHL
jgi:hypothetical protein